MKWPYIFGLLLFAVLPQTGNYKLQSYGFGSGGTAGSKTATYSLEGISGEASGQISRTATNSSNAGTGYITDQQANVPKLLSSDNAAGLYYNKLHFVIDPQGNPSDAKYLVSVSLSRTTTDGAPERSQFTTPQYLHPDGTLSSSFTTADYQTYAGFGGASGSTIIGLSQNTHYYIHLKATQGQFSESGYGPITDQPTAPATITFSLAASAVTLGSLTAGTITPGNQTVSTSFTTNGASGGDVYIRGQNGGLLSVSTGYKIATVSNNLSSLSEGFGGQGSITTGSTAGYGVTNTYNATGSTVGSINTASSSLYSSSSPVVTGNAVLTLLAKAASTDIAATDYKEVLTFTAAANF
jgi:hypothetical protein